MITVDWLTWVISVPKADMDLVVAGPPEIYELDMDKFRKALREMEALPSGMPILKTHDHNTEVTIGPTTFARQVILLAPYTITFEDGQYAVRVVGANTNIEDVTNVNQVSVRLNNTAGLISNRTVAEQVWDADVRDHNEPDSMGGQQVHGIIRVTE